MVLVSVKNIDHYLSIGYEKSKLRCLFFSFDFFGPLLVGKWAWQPRAPLMVWGLQTQPKSWPTGWTFWANRYLEIMSWNFQGWTPLKMELNIQGGGGVDDLGKIKIELSIVSDRGGCQLPDVFTDQNILLPAEVIEFWTCRRLQYLRFKSNFSKMDILRISESNSSINFWNMPLKLGSYVLGVKIKKIIRAKFWLRPWIDQKGHWRFSDIYIFTLKALIKILLN